MEIVSCKRNGWCASQSNARAIHLGFSGQQMCALCPSDAQRDDLGGRCKGHGVDSHLTKWRSTFSRKCHGKWKRVKELRSCPCIDGPDYVFV